MKRILIFCLCLMLGQICHAQNLTHKIGHGETLQSVAEKYDVSEAALLDANPALRLGAHFGMEIVIPQKGDAATASYSNSSFPALFEYEGNARSCFEQQHYGKAAKYYGKCIKLAPDVCTYYYNRGLCAFNDGKYSKAIKDFEACRDRDYSGNLREQTKSLISESYSRRSQKRKEVWDDIAVAAAGVAVVVASTAATAAIIESSSNSNAMPALPATYNSDFDYALAAAQSDAQARAAIAQTGAINTAIARQGVQNATNEYNRKMTQLTNFSSVYNKWSMETAWQEHDIISDKKSFYEFFAKEMGRMLNSEEEELFTQYQLNAYAAKYGIESEPSSTSTSSEESNDTGESDAVRRVREYNQEHYGYKPCHSCQGRKKCQTCNGKTYYYSGMNGEYLPCPNCYLENGQRTGLCGTCCGKGQVYGV